MRRHLLCAVATMAAACAAPAHAATYTLCAEPGPRSPWFQVERGPDGAPTGRLTGLSVELLQAAFARMGHEARIRADLPWSRCMAMVELGKIDFAFDAYRDDERARRFDFSAPYQILTPQVFYLKQTPLKAANVTELKQYRGCGLLGSSYAHYGFARGELDQGTAMFDALIRKLKAGRCDYFPEELESILVVPNADGTFDDPALGHRAIAGARAPARHLITARAGPAAALLPAFGAAVAALYASGAVKAMWHRNVPMLPYRDCPACGRAGSR